MSDVGVQIAYKIITIDLSGVERYIQSTWREMMVSSLNDASKNRAIATAYQDHGKKSQAIFYERRAQSHEADFERFAMIVRKRVPSLNARIRVCSGVKFMIYL